MITKDEALTELIEKADLIIAQWQGPGLEREDRTHIHPLSLAQLRHAIAVWKEIEMVEVYGG